MPEAVYEKPKKDFLTSLTKNRKTKKLAHSKVLAKNYYFSCLKTKPVPLLMRLKISYFTLISLLFGSSIALAQQAPIFTHHPYSQMYSNAGHAGLGEGICIHGISRQQWVGFQDEDGNRVAPETFMVTIDSPVRLIRGGLGAAILQDKLGFESNTIVQLGYAYHLDIGANTLGIGAAANFLNRTVDFSKFKPLQPNDPVLTTSEQSDMLVDANFGLFLVSADFYYVGVSVTSIFESKGKTLNETSESGSFVGDRTFHLSAGYQYALRSFPAYEIHPAVNVISNLASTQINASATVVYNNRFWGGVNYRFQESIGAMVGVLWNDFRIGYAYDVNTMGIGVPGTHELYLGYCFKLKPERIVRSYRNTRYL